MLYEINNECLSLVQLYIYFHSVKNETYIIFNLALPRKEHFIFYLMNYL